MYGSDNSYAFLNDSAAECGNSGLRKCKKSLRYSQKSLFMTVARLQLEIQNRRRIITINQTHRESDVMFVD